MFKIWQYENIYLGSDLSISKSDIINFPISIIDDNFVEYRIAGFVVGAENL